MLDLSHLPQTDLGTVQCLNVLRLYSEPFSVLVGDTDEEGNGAAELRISIDETPAPAEAAEFVSILFYAPFGTVTIMADVAVVDALSDQCLPGWRDEDPKALPMEWRAVFALEDISHATGFADMPLHVIDVIRPDAPLDGPSALPLCIDYDGRRFSGILSMTFGSLEELASYLRPLEQINDENDGLNIRLQPRAAGPATSYDALLGLTKGDVLILPDCRAGRFSLTLSVETGVAWHGTCDEDGNFTLNREETAQ